MKKLMSEYDRGYNQGQYIADKYMHRIKQATKRFKEEHGKSIFMEAYQIGLLLALKEELEKIK